MKYHMNTFLSKTGVVAALLILIGAGCGSDPSTESGKTSAANPLAGIPCPYDDKDLCKFMMNWKEAPSYSSTMKSKEPGEAEMVTEVKQADGGKRSSMLGRQGGKEISNFIMIDGTTYTRDYEAGIWWKFPPQESTPAENVLPEIDIEYSDDGEIEKDTTVYEKLGKEDCGDRQCFKYKVTDPANPEISYWWFDDKDYMMRKMRTESKNGGYFEMVITPGKVTIEPPTGTIKEMGANFINPTGKMTDEELRDFESFQSDLEKFSEGYDIPTE